jgi:RNA polymerase sigma-70 factor (ECF subfamily)
MWFLFAVVERSRASWAEDRSADQAALARMAGGDHQALAELYDRHARPIYSLALRVLQDPAEAEDVVQDVFARAWTQAARYDTGRGAVAAWLLNMTRSRAIDRLRSRRSRPAEDADRQDALDNMPGAGVPQDVQLLSAEQVMRLRDALRDLPALQRIAVELAYYEGLTHAEIAARLEQPLGTVKTRIRQAMIKLRESMAGNQQ